MSPSRLVGRPAALAAAARAHSGRSATLPHHLISPVPAAAVRPGARSRLPLALAKSSVLSPLCSHSVSTLTTPAFFPKLSNTTTTSPSVHTTAAATATTAPFSTSSPAGLKMTDAATTGTSNPSARAEPLRLGSIAPDFEADTTDGPIRFHDFIDRHGGWVVFFSHPEDYTPVCTTELGAFAKLQPEFEKRNTALIGLSANSVESHRGWVKDIDEVTGSKLAFPIIGDKSRHVAYLYDMIDHQDATNVDAKNVALTIRSVFIIDPAKVIRTILAYPASTGRNSAEVLRILDSLQTADRFRVTTPIDWRPGQDVIVHPAVPTAEAEKVFPEVRVVKPYLRFTPDPRKGEDKK